MLVFQAFAKDVPWGGEKNMGDDTLLAAPQMRYL